MITIERKPLSINEVFRGRRFRTKEYDKYQEDVLFLLPLIKLPDPPYRLDIIVGYSNAQSDLDNAIKPFVDILQHKYGFNDKLIHEIHAIKKVVKKGKEYVAFNLTHYQEKD